MHATPHVSPLSAPEKRFLAQSLRIAGATIRKQFWTVSDGRQKRDPSDLVTNADLASERIVLSALRKHFPSWSVRSEEHGWTRRDSPYLFVLDPLDGTFNFVLGVPQFSVSLALLHGDDIVSGFVYHPMLDVLYHAHRGGGAWRDHTRLHVSPERRLSHLTAAYSQGYGIAERTYFKHLWKLRLLRLMSNWAPALDLCLVASGRVGAFVSMRNALYDYAAGKLIAAEAGAAIVQLDGTVGGPN
ncbi:MAG: inositol monophosphatase, partial [Candidatus Kerfeldbacteria bacterium]|nr:inositol monophosphatase [Candidatus Kerfeldbacteria bacterium]